MKLRWLAVAVSIVGAAEGLRTTAYLDPVGVPTICFGHTEQVRMGDRKSVSECKDLLWSEVLVYAEGVSQSVDYELSGKEYAAYTSFAYNVGLANWNRSTLLKRLRAGRRVAACNELLKWKYAKGVVLPGLLKRRADERAVCLEGVSEGG